METQLPDIPRYFTAIAEWAACMLFAFQVRRRLSGWRLMLVAFIALIVQCAFLTLTGGIRSWLWILVMAGAVALMICFVRLLIAGSFADAVYCGLQAFIIAEFAASLEWQLYLFSFQGDNASALVKNAFMVLIYLLIYAAIWGIYRRHRPAMNLLRISTKELYSVGIIAISVFAISNLSFLNIPTPFTAIGVATISIVRTMVDFAGVAIMYAYHVQRIEARAHLELDMLQSVLKSQLLQYEQSKESIDLINYKYHDLKHQIAALRAEIDSAQQTDLLDRMEEEIRQYELQNKTGNSVVDTILTSKSMLCEKHGISLNCVIDGKLLDFMDVMDICSILGNAVDNAIEYEQNVADPEKRLIHIAIFSQQNFLILRFENYFEGELNMDDGLPVSTKRLKELHGYGLKSIKYTVKKYDGAVSVSVHDHWFELKILIPLPESDSVKKNQQPFIE